MTFYALLPALGRLGIGSAVALALLLPALRVEAQSGGAVEGPDERLMILAASSLSDALPAVAQAWRRRGGVDVGFSFAATSRLAPQVVEGAPADIFFSADDTWMEWLVERGEVDVRSVRDLLGNELVVVAPVGRPAPTDAGALAGLSRLALAGENVPAGRYAREALEGAGVWGAVADRVVRGGSARGTLEWVARGEVDAGIVYRSDALAEPAVNLAFAFDPGSHAPVRYRAAVLRRSSRQSLAQAFLDFAQAPEALDIFGAAGFVVSPRSATMPTVRQSVGPLPSVSSAVRISILVAVLATLAGLPLAVAVGFVLARRDFPGKVLVSTAALAPLVMPPVVTGFLLLSLLGRDMPMGRLLASLGLPVPFTLLGAIVAALVVGLPLYILSVRNAFEAVDVHYEELSWTLGVPPRRTFWRVSLPLALPGIAAGGLLAFARALGEFGATIVLAGNVEGDTRTIALAVYTLLESPSGRGTMWVLVGASVAISLAALVGYEALSRRQRRRLELYRG